MPRSRTIVPSHFNQRWDIVPQREGIWDIVNYSTVIDRLYHLSRTKPDLTVAGDCMAAIGCHRNHLDLVWFDAHGDFHTLTTTQTGHIGGMPLAMLWGLGDLSLLEACGVSPIWLDRERRVYHVGGSEFDTDEKKRMIGSGIKLRDRDSVEDITQPIHLHIDTDVLCSEEYPCSIHPAPNGISIAKLLEQVGQLLRYTEVFSIKTYDPRLDSTGIGQSVVLELIRMFDAQRKI